MPAGFVVAWNTYLGAFWLPGSEERLAAFAYGGNAMRSSPDGDVSDIPDSFPRSLFVMGHDRLPDGDQMAEPVVQV